ncbi:hypothetical protein [Sphingomicrobium marinum]|uniref:hypothetical protein n=1 Tax=Sphingomicrobium marinum TaxID=1227950 RepID=UPI002240AE69|nr:hypothetical protein [Sphingomicrobium marinum]
MDDRAAKKPLMPAGCWQIPSFILFGAIALGISGRHFMLVLAIGAISAIIYDLARSAIVDQVSPLVRLSDRRRDFALLAIVAVIAAFRFFSQ